MPTLLECTACRRHLRADEPRCPFCGTPFTTAAPRRWVALVGWLPLLIGCSGDAEPASQPGTPTREAAEPGPESNTPPPGPTDPPRPEPTTTVKPEPESPLPADETTDDGAGQPSAPPDLGTTIEPPKKPEVDRPMATKYGLPPRPAKKYGGPPKPDPDDPLRGL